MWTAIIGAVLSGIASESASKRASKDKNKELAATRELAMISGNEDRATLDYSRKLDEFYRKKQRSELSGAWDNWFGAKPATTDNVAPRLEDYQFDYNNPPQSGG